MADELGAVISAVVMLVVVWTWSEWVDEQTARTTRRGGMVMEPEPSNVAYQGPPE